MIQCPSCGSTIKEEWRAILREYNWHHELKVSKMTEQTGVEETLACPIPIGEHDWLCGEEKCAWFVKSAKKCAILVFAEDLHQALQMGALLKALAGRPDILRKMA